MSRDKQIFICTSQPLPLLLGRQALLTINKVAEINFAKNEMKIKFMPAFLATLGQEIRISVPGRASSHQPCCTAINLDTPVALVTFLLVTISCNKRP
jgi:hypothetical protein